MKFRKIHSLTVEFEDVDSYKIAHHTKLVAFLERARVRFFQLIDIEINLEKYPMVMYDLNVKFQKPALFLDQLDIHMTVEVKSQVKLVLFYKIYRDSDLLYRASTTLSFVDDSGLIPVPDEIQRKLEKFTHGASNE